MRIDFFVCKIRGLEGVGGNFGGHGRWGGWLMRSFGKAWDHRVCSQMMRCKQSGTAHE